MSDTNYSVLNAMTDIIASPGKAWVIAALPWVLIFGIWAGLNVR